MNFAFNAEQDMLRDSALRLLRYRVDLGKLTAQGNRPDTRYEAPLWRSMVELGWSGLTVPEQYGGLGLSMIDFVVQAEELGRSLAPCPDLGNFAGTRALLVAGSEAQKQTLLPAVLSGAAQLALACDEAVPDRAGAGNVCGAAACRVVDGRLSGSHRYVFDADDATHIVVSARDVQGTPWLYLVDRSRGGVQLQDIEWMDITRRVCELRFAATPCERLPQPFASAWPLIRDAVLLALAAENAGGADAILRRTVAYANERVQFGRPIASFQAIKHKCADMLMKVESAKALSYFAAWALSESPREAALAAAMAKSYSDDAYKLCTAEAVQIHGAIGFTWAMPVHLYFKRARANAALYGNSRALRDRVIQLAVASRAA